VPGCSRRTGDRFNPPICAWRLAVEGRKVLAANQTASALVRRYIDGKSGVVRVGGTPFFMDGVISAMIAEFQRAYPEIRIEQSYAYAADLSRQLDSNALDVAICPMDPSRASGEHWHSRRIA
jgi:DNA-binding transcriptional LysR family regulator